MNYQPKTTNWRKTRPGFFLPLAIFFVFLVILAIAPLWFYIIQYKINKPEPSPTTQTQTSTPSATQDDIANWKTYTDDKYGLSFLYPLDYRLDNSNPDLIFIEDSGETSPGRSQRITIDARLAEAYADYDKAAKLLIEQSLNDSTKKVDSQTDSMISVSSTPYTIPGVENNTPLYDKDIYWKHKNGAVTAHYSSVNGERAKVFDQILSTFKFTQ